MAEGLAVVGIIASIIQLLQFSSRVLKRLKDYQSKFGDIPEAFRQIKTELPVLLDALQQIKAVDDAGYMQQESKKALEPAVEECRIQIKVLDDVISKALPKPGEFWARKAIGSIRYDAKVEKITAAIRGYVSTLTYHATSSILNILANRSLPQPAASFTLPISSNICHLDLGSAEASVERERDRFKTIGVAHKLVPAGPQKDYSKHKINTNLRGVRGGSARGGNACGSSARGGDARGGNAHGGNARGGNAQGGNARGRNARGGNAHGGNACDDKLSS